MVWRRDPAEKQPKRTQEVVMGIGIIGAGHI
jgi:hypothetical protein